MSEPVHDAQMTSLETALAALVPRPAALDRDRLMFLAGRRSVGHRGWLLPSLSAALASAATLLAVLLLYHPQPRIVQVPAPPAPPSQMESILAGKDDHWKSQVESLRLRNEVLRGGVEALPEPSRSEARDEPLNLDSLLQ